MVAANLIVVAFHKFDQLGQQKGDKEDYKEKKPVSYDLVALAYGQFNNLKKSPFFLPTP